MNINEDMRESVEKIWNVHEQAIRLMQWRKLSPPISIYVLGYMMNKWEMASFQGRETTEKRLFAMLADLRRTDRVRAVKQLLIEQRRLETSDTQKERTQDTPPQVDCIRPRLCSPNDRADRRIGQSDLVPDA